MILYPYDLGLGKGWLTSSSFSSPDVRSLSLSVYENNLHFEPWGLCAKHNAGVHDKALAYPTPPPSNPEDPKGSRSFNFTIVEQVRLPLHLNLYLTHLDF